MLSALLATAFLASVPAIAASQDGEQPAAKLRRLQAEIAKLNAAEHDEIARKHKALAELGSIEERIGTLNRGLAELSSRTRELAGQRQTLAHQADRAQGAAAAAEQELGSLLRAAFVLGREPALKLVLEGDDPATTARLLGYYGYYSRAQTGRIATLTAEVSKYQQLRDEVAATTQKLNTTAAAQRQSLADLEQAHAQREALVAQLTSDIADKHARAESLRRDAARLEKIIRSVNRDVTQTPAPRLEHLDFAKLRGRLPWPVAGKIVDHYGSPREEGELTWHAVRIAAPAGTLVRAIARGRVVYAGWLPYYGLVLILDHGDGFLSVYGHNGALYKQVGDWVHAGDVIATVGDSGGQPQPMLYFQLRHDDQPLDPEEWCAHR